MEKEIKIENPYGFIYITTNLINGKRYIGQKQFDMKSRWKSYLGSGYHLMKSINKYGKENFKRDIVDIAVSPEELNEKEINWINNYSAVDSDDYYNQMDGGINLDSLVRKNSIRCVCIDNGMVFDSLASAAMWSGYTVPKIKRSFKKKHTYENYKNEEYIFRLIKYHKYFCKICAKKLSKDRQYTKICLKCNDEIKKVRCIECHIVIENAHHSRKRCNGCQKVRNRETAKFRKQKQRENKKVR